MNLKVVITGEKLVYTAMVRRGKGKLIEVARHEASKSDVVAQHAQATKCLQMAGRKLKGTAS